MLFWALNDNLLNKTTKMKKTKKVKLEDGLENRPKLEGVCILI